MGLLLRSSCRAPLVFCGLGYPVQTHSPVPLRARVLNQTRFLVPGADGAVWEDFLDVSSVCLLGVAVETRSTISTHSQ